jgi:hypothetical protein
MAPTPAEKAALTRRRRAAGAKAAATRKRRTAARKAAATRKGRAAGRKAADTRKRRTAGRKGPVTRKLRAAGKKAGATRKRRTVAKKAVATRRARLATRRGEQTTDRGPTDAETVLEVGTEGGSLSILRTRAPDGAWRFALLTNESALDDDDRRTSSFSPKPGSVETFAAALQLINRYPWHTFMPLQLHKEYAAAVRAEVLRRGGKRDLARWELELPEIKQESA